MKNQLFTICRKGDCFMKRLVAYLMCICSLFMSSITVFAQGESSVSITNNEIADKAATLLTSIQGESTYYGMENVDFSKLYLGQEIPVYKFSENGYERTEVKAFPVLEDTKCVSIVYCSIDANNNEPILGIGGNLAEKFENVNLEKGVALIVKNGNVQVYQENATLASYDGNGIVQVSNVLNEKCYLQIGPLTRASKNLNVPLVSQGSPSLKCWAACMRSIGLYYGVDRTIDQIYEAAGIPKYEGNGDLNQISRQFNSQFGRTTSHYYVSFANLKKEIDQGHPVFASNKSPAGVKHATVLRGYIDGSVQSISYMNPSYPTTYWTVQIRSDGKFPVVEQDFTEWGIMHDSIVVK